MSEQRDSIFEIEIKPPLIPPKLSARIKTDHVFVYPDSIPAIEIKKLLESDQKHIVFPTRIQVAFPIQTIRPKVHKERIVPHKQLPLAVAQERKRKYHASISVEKLLEQNDIDPYNLVVVESIKTLYPHLFTSISISKQPFFLPLRWFMNDDFDEFSIESWLRLGFVDNQQYPLPGIAYVPNIPFTTEHNEFCSNMPVLIRKYYKNQNLELLRKKLFTWRFVAISDYNYKTDRWIIQDLESSYKYEIKKIYFVFIAENPFNYILRLQNALKQRKYTEILTQFELMLDTLVLLTNLPKYNIQLLNRIVKLTNYRYFNVDNRILDMLYNEINIFYQRIMIKYEFKQYMSKHPNEYENYKNIDEIEQHFQHYPKLTKIDKFDYINIKDLTRILTFNSIFYLPQPVLAMSFVCAECIKAQSMYLFTWTAIKPLGLPEFQQAQNVASFITTKYLKSYWIDTIANHIHLCLRTVGKGWVDILYSDFGIFKFSKMYKFLSHVKFRMESTLRLICENSIAQYCNLICTPCIGLFNIVEHFYEWPENFINNPYKQHGPPVFFLTIDLNENGYVYSTNINDFLPICLGIYSGALSHLCYIPLVDRQILSFLKFAPNLYLDLGLDIDSLYQTKIAYLEYSIKKSLLPLMGYGRKYNEFTLLYMLNITEYINQLKKLNVSAGELKETILNNKRLRQELIDKLPASIVIGPYFINCDNLKNHLIKKRTNIINALFVLFTDRMTNINDDLIDKFNEIYLRLLEKPTSIEHIYESKAFIQKIPEKLELLQEKLRIMLIEYDILEFFLYNLSDDLFRKKWLTFGFPHKITSRIAETNDQLKLDIEVFKKIQFSETNNFQDRLESLNDEVAQYTLKFDPLKGEEMSVEAKKIMKSIKDAEVAGAILAKRQILFELDPISLDFIASIKSSFKPYYELWLNGQKFISIVDICTGNTLVSLDIPSMKAQIENVQTTLEESKIIFAEKPEFIEVAKYYLNLISLFQTSIDIIECVKDENWLPIHWTELSHKAKIEIKYSPSLNFQFCIKKGILNHGDIVKEILYNATLQSETLRKQYEEEERQRLELERIEAEKRQNRKCRKDIL